MSSSDPTAAQTKKNKPALVFGATGEQGRAVVEGLVAHGHHPVFAYTRQSHDTYLTDGLGAVLRTGDISDPTSVKAALLETKAQAIFLVTTTEFHHEVGADGFRAAAEAEVQVIRSFFDVLKRVHAHDHLPRHVVMSTQDNVQELAEQEAEAGRTWIEPLADGSIVPHYSAKGLGGEIAVGMLRDVPGLKLTLITMPFLYSNFLGFFAPLPINEGRTQWALSACFGDGSNAVDMMAASDLSTIVPNILANPDVYDGQNLRLVGERLSMDQVAAEFADLFGKDVVYNPLTVPEVCVLPFASAPAMAQMCQFLGDPRSLQHDLEATEKLTLPRHPQKFQDWLLTHSDSTAFQRVGLDLDAPEIKSVTVFGASSMEGSSVVKGLLEDSRKEYKIRVTAKHPENPVVQSLQLLDPERVEIVAADLESVESCAKALEGVGGAFLVSSFYSDSAGDNGEVAEDRHMRNVIDACAASQTVKHLVFSTMESVKEVDRILDLGLKSGGDLSGREVRHASQFDSKERAAAYARTKKLSVTCVLMPCYNARFFDMIDMQGDERQVMTVPLPDHRNVKCICVDELGTAVANIFDSYQVYAGHEVGLVSDFVTLSVHDVSREGENKDDANMEVDNVAPQEWELRVRDTYMKDLGPMFAYMAHSDAVRERQSIAKSLELLPSAKPLRQWVEANVDNAAFREKLGLR